MTIDSHHHFWRYDPLEYDWISDSMEVLRRDFLPADLQREIIAAGIRGVVSVQARQTVGETRFLLDLAAANDFILGVVGWVPLVDPGVTEILAEFAADPKLRACRHVLQDEPDDEYMLRHDFNEGVRAVTAAGLAYDILIFERHLPHTLTFVDAHPDQIFVIDHIAKPCIRDGSFSAWRADLLECARRPHVYCKVSGMVTEAHWQRWTLSDLLPYLDTVLEAFGPERLMFGSDWPVCLVATGYGRWASLVADYAARLGSAERDRIFGGTAAEAYGLEPGASLQ